jgi:hypothetical protein
MPRTKLLGGPFGVPIGTPLGQKRRFTTSPIIEKRMRAEPQNGTGFAAFKFRNVAHFAELARGGFLDVCEYYAATSLTWEEIRRGREQIERIWIEESGPRKQGEQHRMSKAELNRMFVLYDWHFFGGAFERLLSENAQKLVIVQRAALSDPAESASSRTSALCIRTVRGRSCTYTIELTESVGYHFDPNVYGDLAIYDEDEIIPTYSVGGLLCRSWLECTQLLLEHEIVHLLMFMWQKCVDPDKAPGGKNHGETWRRLARNIFGHYKHTSGLSDELVMYDAGRAEKEWEVAERVRRTLRVGAKIRIGGDFCVVETLPEATEENEHFTARSVDGTEHRVRFLDPFRVARTKRVAVP